MESQTYKWLWKNKHVILLAILSICLTIVTIVLSAKLNNASACMLKTTNVSSIFNNKSKVTEITNYRLPRHVVPKNYKLLLRPNMTNKTFSGMVTITLQVHEATEKVILHSNQLNITSTAIRNKEEEIKIKSTSLITDKREFLIINLKKKILPIEGNYELVVMFSGRLDKGFVSFYQSTLKNGKTMVASKFEPTYARQTFPCFDEPDFKATFDISLVKPVSYVALSNMNEISSHIEDNGTSEIVKFATSVPMSTYLACFVVCDFDFKQNEINAHGIGNNFTLRSFAQADQMHKIDFAQDIGRRATEFYIQYYEVPFPLPKLDMIAIPDYVSGATEHWGLITYRETSFLIDEATASSRNKVSVANTVVHELAHMWFGNLVTMKWWDDLWLNEGFASYMQVKSLNAIEPSWKTSELFLTRTMHSVLVTDAKLSSHPIVQTVSTPDEITAIFDTISYNKGSSVLRMLEGFIGEEYFRRGVSDYLQKYKFDNTVTKDLLACLEPYFKKEYPDLKISYIMDTWTRQMGYPLLTIVTGDEPNQYVITQKRFLLDPEAVYENDSDFKYRWFIPITYSTNYGPNKNVLWFPDSEDKVHLNLKDGETLVKINNNQVGYYRVNYPTEMWHQLYEVLIKNPEQLTPSDRANILNDAFALADAGYLPYELALKLSIPLRGEQALVPWEAAASVFDKLAARLTNTVAYDALEIFIQKLLSSMYEKQSWEKTQIGITKSLIRSKILSLATRYRLPSAEGKVRTMFLDWLSTHGSPEAVVIEPDLRDFVYYYGMRSATNSEWDKLWQIYLKEEDAQEQTKMRSALAAPNDTHLLRKYLNMAWDERYIRSQDYLNVISQISGNPAGAALIWDDVRTRWPDLVQRFSLNSRYLGNLIPTVTGNFNTDAKLKEMEAFFAQYPEAGAGETARRRALETVRNNIKWTNRYHTAIGGWLESYRFP